MTTRTVTALPHTEMSVGPKWDGHQGNWDDNRVYPINKIVIHTMVGTIQSANARFNDPASNVSAHYGVGYDGSLVHWVDEDKVAYHSGDYAINQSSIGLEHEDMGQYDVARPEALYTTSAKVVAGVCNFYGVPCDRDHIKKHSEVSDAPTGCPDSLDIDRIVREANLILNPAPTLTPTNVGNPPIAPDVPLVLSDAQNIQLGATLGVWAVGAIRSEILDRRRDVASAQGTIAHLSQLLDDANKQIEALQLINKTQVETVKTIAETPLTSSTPKVYHAVANQPISPPIPASLLARMLNWLFRQ